MGRRFSAQSGLLYRPRVRGLKMRRGTITVLARGVTREAY